MPLLYTQELTQKEGVIVAMAHDISIMVAGLCIITLAVMLLPDNFAMPVDEEGNFWKEPARKPDVDN